MTERVNHYYIDGRPETITVVQHSIPTDMMGRLELGVLLGLGFTFGAAFVVSMTLAISLIFRALVFWIAG